MLCDILEEEVWTEKLLYHYQWVFTHCIRLSDKSTAADKADLAVFIAE